MKKIIAVFFCVLLFSCKSQKITLSPFIVAYKSDWVGNIYPEYILLRTQPKVFEIYTPGIHGSIYGEWQINNDTLLFFPRHEYLSRNSELKIFELTAQDSSVATIVRQYLIRNDSLIDMTDYNIILQGLFSNQNNKVVYQRITNE